jgi:hypothetical protein
MKTLNALNYMNLIIKNLNVTVNKIKFALKFKVLYCTEFILTSIQENGCRKITINDGKQGSRK